MGIINTYKEFKQFEPTYNEWHNCNLIKNSKKEQILKNKPITPEVLKEQQRAKILIDTYTTLDEYAQTKAEDIDSVSQTLLYISVGILGATGTFLGKKISNLFKNQKVAKTLPSIMGIGFALATFLPFVQTTVINQVRVNRIARFDGLHNNLFHLNNFALLTDAQKKEALEQAKKMPDKAVSAQNSIINRSNLFNSLSVFKKFTMKQGEFAYLKKQHDKKLTEDFKKVKKFDFKKEELEQAQKDKKLFNDIIKKVDLESHYTLEKIEKIVNVAYSSMFAGGVLEYLVSDGILNLLKVKNKIVRPVLSCGLPILTIMFLNKQLANFLNDAIKAVRYNKMQEFVNDINNFKQIDDSEINVSSEEVTLKKEKNSVQVFKDTLKSIKDYQKYQKTKRIEEKKFAQSVKNIELTESQKKEAKLLKRNTELAINTLDDQTQKYAMSLEALSESITIPLDIIAPLIGTFSADKLHKHFSPNGHYRGLFKGLGAIIAFLPAAMSEIYFVGQQRKAARAATLIATNNLQDENKFLDPSSKDIDNKKILQKWNFNSYKNDAFMSFRINK